jgi:hypothetical protein
MLREIPYAPYQKLRLALETFRYSVYFAFELRQSGHWLPHIECLEFLFQFGKGPRHPRESLLDLIVEFVSPHSSSITQMKSRRKIGSRDGNLLFFNLC